MEYRCRANLFETERCYRLVPAGVEISAAAPASPQASATPELPLLIPYRSIVGVRLKYAPTRVQKKCYLCIIRLDDGRSFTLVNQSFRGLADVVDQSMVYCFFVLQFHKELLGALGPTVSQCEFRAGSTSSGYAANVGCMALGLLAAAVAAVIFTFSGLLVVVIIKLVVIAMLLPRALRFLKINRPRNYPPDDVPRHLLPPL